MFPSTTPTSYVSKGSSPDKSLYNHGGKSEKVGKQHKPTDKNNIAGESTNITFNHHFMGI